MPRYVYISRPSFTPGVELDLTGFETSNERDTCQIDLGKWIDGIPQLKLNYEYFQLLFDSTIKIWQKDRVYRQLLDKQQKDGFTFGFQKLDKEYKKFKYTRDNTLLGRVHNWIDASWWEYGYEKSKVITNSILIFRY